MKPLQRFFKHLFLTKAAARRVFPENALRAIQNAIADGEKLHRAEIRIVIEPSLSIGDLLQNLHPRQRARELFSLYRMWDTEENCGVLIYINLADHKVEIVTDRASGRALRAEDWHAICKIMTQGFAQERYEESALSALQQLNGLLQKQFPSNGDTINELSNRPLIL